MIFFHNQSVKLDNNYILKKSTVGFLFRNGFLDNKMVINRRDIEAC